MEQEAQGAHRGTRVGDSARLRAVNRHVGRATPDSNPALTEIVEQAAQACRTPMALVTLVGADRQWVKAGKGLALTDVPLDRSICAKAIEHGGVFVVPDTSLDPRVNANPFVYGDPHIAFYAGAPLMDAEGNPLGMICVLDTAPRPQGLSEEQQALLVRLSRKAMDLLDRQP